MRLEIFDFVDNSISMLEDSYQELYELSFMIENTIRDNLLSNPAFLNVTSRIKTPSSLKEKIIRNNYYLKYSSPKNFFYNLTDLIGIRIECRFIEDEKKIYDALIKLFNCRYESPENEILENYTDIEGFPEFYYYNSQSPELLLCIDKKQPQQQKNGFEIFRLDGLVIHNDKKIRFELQIKSLVNLFWGEVEHKILYKNYNYMPMEKFYKDIMYSINGNMMMIDRQLMILHDHLYELSSYDPAARSMQFKSMLTKSIYEFYSLKIKEKLGFIVDFRNTCEVITDYIINKERTKIKKNQSEIIMDTIFRFNEIALNEVEFDEYIIFEREPKFEDEFSSKVGAAIHSIINKDFKWSMLFKIVFDMEPGNNCEDFEGFITYLKKRFYLNMSESQILFKDFSYEEKSAVISEILNIIADIFTAQMDIDFINNNNIEVVNSYINKELSDVKDYNHWSLIKNEFIKEFNGIIYYR